jgi:hypothetical protein
MDAEAGPLLVSLLVSVVGFALLMYGKKQRRVPQLAVGLLMMVFPYFVPGVLLPAVIAVALVGLLVVAVKLGI